MCKSFLGLLLMSAFFVAPMISMKISIPIFGRGLLPGFSSVKMFTPQFPQIKKLITDFGGCLPPVPPEISGLATNEGNQQGNHLLFLALSTANSTAVIPDDKMPLSRPLPEPYNSFLKWWESKTAGRSGLLILLVPGLISQLMIFERALTFFVDRLLQYMQPIQTITALSLLTPIGLQIVKSCLWGSIFIGAGYMIFDTFKMASLWTQLIPNNESYGVITGASSGIGFEIAKLMYINGFNIVMIARDMNKLMDARDYLRETYGSIHDSNKQRSKLSKGYVIEDSNGKDEPLKTENPMVNSEPTDSNGDGSIGGDNEINGHSPVIADTIQLKRRPVKNGINKIVNDIQRVSGSIFNILHRFKDSSFISLGSTADLDPQNDKIVENRFVSQYPYYPYNTESYSDDNSYFGGYESSEMISGPVDASYGDIIVISSDLSLPQSTSWIVSKLFELDVLDKVQILVNNAGSGLRAPFRTADTSRLADMMELNTRASVLLTRKLIGHIKDNVCGAGRVVFISSTASYGPGKNVAVYSATKAFITSLAKSLRRELIEDNIFVTLACPGPVLTNFADSASASNALVFNVPGLAMTAERAGADIYKAMEQGRDLVVPGFFSKVYAHVISRILPYPVVASFVKMAWEPAPKWLSKRRKSGIENPFSDEFAAGEYSIFDAGESKEKLPSIIEPDEIIDPAPLPSIVDSPSHQLPQPLPQPQSGDKFKRFVVPSPLPKFKDFSDKVLRSLRRQWVHFWFSPIIDYRVVQAKLNPK